MNRSPFNNRIAKPSQKVQDIHPDVMEDIMRGMQVALPEPSWEEIDNWLNTHNIASNIPGWCDHVRGLTSGQS